MAYKSPHQKFTELLNKLAADAERTLDLFSLYNGLPLDAQKAIAALVYDHAADKMTVDDKEAAVRVANEAIRAIRGDE